MIAVVREEVVVCAEEVLRDLLDYCFDFGFRSEGEALQDGATEGASWRLEVWSCPVDPGDLSSVVAAVCVFLVADDHAGVQEAAAEGP